MSSRSDWVDEMERLFAERDMLWRALCQVLIVRAVMAERARVGPGWTGELPTPEAIAARLLAVVDEEERALRELQVPR